MFEQTYIDNRLDMRAGSPWPAAGLSATAFVNRIARSKVNYQFTQPLSLRWILDYAAVRPDQRLVALEREQRLQADVLLTYLVNPGTAVYVGYTDRAENLLIEKAGSSTLKRVSTLANTGRQFFVKLSYLLRL